MESRALLNDALGVETLANYNIRKFCAAMHSGRLVAFVGAFATVPLGYLGWDDFLKKYKEITTKAAGSTARITLPQKTQIDATTLIDSYLLNAVSQRKKPRNTPTGLADEVAKALHAARLAALTDLFQLPEHPPAVMDQSVPYHIVNSLGINRVITTNYDLEFEWQLMLTAAERNFAADPSKRQDVLDKYLKKETSGGIKRDDGSDDGPSGGKGSGMLYRRLSSGRFVTSDVFYRQRTDRLFEFSLGSMDQDAHILHLHGRALPDDVETLVISRDDYDQLYRRQHVGKLPFEHALTALYGGNPVIFIGSGMKEADLVKTLEQFAANATTINRPPTFVLWSPFPKDFKKGDGAELAAAKLAGSRKYQNEYRYIREDYFRRFGVLTILDTDPKMIEWIKRIADRAGRDRMSVAIEALANLVKNNNQPPAWSADLLRSAQDRIGWDIAQGANPNHRRHDVWGGAINEEGPWTKLLGSPPTSATARNAPTWGSFGKDEDLLKPLFGGPAIKAFIDEPGAGHGFLSKFIGCAFTDVMGNAPFAPNSSRSVIGASFMWEIDSAFSLVSALYDGKTAFADKQSREEALRYTLEKYSEKSLGNTAKYDDVGLISRDTQRILIVINGADRFFETSGYPLSAELDAMIRMVAKMGNTPSFFHPQGRGGLVSFNEWTRRTGYAAPISLILLGTQRVRRYLNGLGLIPDLDGLGGGDYIDFTHAQSSIGKKWLKDLIERQEVRLPDEGIRYRRKSGESGFLEHAVPNLKPDAGYRIAHQTAAGIAKGRQAGAVRRQALSAMLRSSVLAEMLDKPALSAAGASKPTGLGKFAPLAHHILSAFSFFGSPIELEALVKTPRVVRCMNELEAKDTDCKAVLDKLIEHHFVFEFNAYVNMPAGGFARYGLHSTVMQQLREEYGLPLSEAKLSAGFNLSLYASQPIDDYSPDPDMHVELTEVAEAMLAVAHSSVREKATVRHELAIAASCLRGALSLLRGYFTTASLVMREPKPLAFEGVEALLKDQAERLARIADLALALAELCKKAEVARPLYPDDLVWLYNEIGMVRLEQGDLYKARIALRQAKKINEDFVEFGDHSHNWRRIQMNMVHVDIERGRLVDADSRMLRIESSLADYVGAVGASTHGDEAHKFDVQREGIIDRITRDYGTTMLSQARPVDPRYPADAVLIGGMLVAYRALIDHLRGELDRADIGYERACQIFRNLDERRALAMFSNNRGSLLDSLNKKEKAQEIWEQSIGAADATRQSDLSITAKLARAESRVANASTEKLEVVTRQIRIALHYGQVSRMHRVHMEARKAMALLRYKSGDYDGALEQVSSALAVAARYGFTLRKISLRVMLGQIMIKRGDIKTGRALVRQAILFAERIGYQRAVQLGQKVMIEDGFD